MGDITVREIENGRKLFGGQWEFSRACASSRAAA